MATLSPADIAYQQAHIHEDRGPMVVAVSGFLIAISTVVVALRFFARWHRHLPFGVDDALCLAGLVFLVCMCAINFVSVNYGLGKHLLATDPTKGYKILQAGLYLALDYAVTQWCIKMALLTTYVRFFGMHKRWFKYTVWFVGFYVTAWALAQFFAALFQCRPVSYFWEQFDMSLQPPAQGKCVLKNNPLAISTSALNTLADFMLLLMPLPLLWSLNLPLARKVGVMAIFAVGIFGCVASILRLTSTLTSIAVGTDSTWNVAIVYIWTATEACVQLLCACFPVIGPLFAAIPDKVRSVITSTISSNRHSMLSDNTVEHDDKAKRNEKKLSVDTWSSYGSRANSQISHGSGSRASVPAGRILRDDDFSVSYAEKQETDVSPV